jgi:hypothetical protein
MFWYTGSESLLRKFAVMTHQGLQISGFGWHLMVIRRFGALYTRKFKSKGLFEVFLINHGVRLFYFSLFLVVSRCFSLFLVVSRCFSLFLVVSRCFSLFLIIWIGRGQIERSIERLDSFSIVLLH